MDKRYETDNKLEGLYQPDSNSTVLVNKLGINVREDIDDIELSLLNLLYEEILSSLDVNQLISVDDICEWHRKWLGNVYQWAGSYRSVNMSKDAFHFASAMQIPQLMTEFNNKFLAKYTPCHEMKEDELINAISIIHVEFILVHPFREGNGRLARLIANIMALQAGYPELDFSVLDKYKDKYFKAIQIGLNCNYEPLKQLFRQVLQNSEKAFDPKF